MPIYRRFIAALTVAILTLICAPAVAETPADYDMSAPENLLPGHLYAESALLVDAETGEILFSKNSKVRMYPASTTKIMTLLLALESGIPLDQQVTIPPEAADIPQGSSVIPVQPGDVLRFEDLLYGFMLSSGNDGANAVAVLTEGSIEAFVEHMNARAASLGMEGTQYVNAHGYHDAQHYTTAQDLAILSRAAMENEAFRRIVAAPTWTVALRRGEESLSLEIVSRNSLLQSDLKYYYPECTGIKTGHHNKAGWCFVGSAQRAGRSVICVVLNCQQENDKWYDAARLFEYGFTRYTDLSLTSLLGRAFERFSTVQIADAAEDDPQGGALSLALGAIQGGEAPIAVVAGSPAAEQSAVVRVAQGVSIQWKRPLEAPIDEGEEMGVLTCALEDGTVATARLTAARSVSARSASASPQQTAAGPAEGLDGDAPARPDPGTDSPASHSANRGLIVVLALLLGLLLASLIALAILRGQRRRRRRRRARRRSGR